MNLKPIEPDLFYEIKSNICYTICMEDLKQTENTIKVLLNRIKPYIRSHGGDIEFVRYEEGFVYIKMTGACDGCAFVDETLEYGIEELLMEEIPGVLGVMLV